MLALLSPASSPPAGAAEVALRVAGVTAAVLAADEQRRIAEQTARGAKASEITARSVAVRLEAHEALADAALEGGDPDGALAAAAARIATVSTCAVQRLRPDGTLEPAALHVEGNALREPVGRVLGRPLDVTTAVVARALAGEVVVLDADDADAGPLAPFVQSGSSAALDPARPARRDPRRRRDGLARSDAPGDGRRGAGGAPARLALSGRLQHVSVIAGALRREMQHCPRALVAPSPRRRCGARLRRAAGRRVRRLDRGRLAAARAA